MMTKKVVIKLGGSLLFNEGKIRVNKVQEFIKVIKEIPELAAIVVGGGEIARSYISAARSFNAGESICDMLGIEVARINARLLITALGEKAYPEPIKNFEDARTASLFNKIILAGGFVPGQSTTSVTFQIAEAINASEILILTNVDGIYEHDPKKNPLAKKYDSITVDNLQHLIDNGGNKQAAAGEYRIFDAVSIQIFKRSKVKVRILSGENPEKIKQLIQDGSKLSTIGTEILR